MNIIFATNNKGKIKEIGEIMQDLPLPVISMEEAGLDMDIIEDGTTFEENAKIKAKAVAKIFPNAIVLADDSGLEIDYLNKEPGVYSARFSGKDTPYSVKNQIFLDKLKDVPPEKRTARFVCVIAAIFPDGSEKLCRATLEGQIATESSGEHGFGFDPIFYLPEYGCTTATLSPELKNSLSHRGKALEEMKEMIRKYMTMECLFL